MSTVKADYLVNAAGTGAPTFSNGIISNGDVGIGTSSPTSKLDVRSGDITVSRTAAATAGDASIYFGNGNTNYIFGGNVSNIMAFAVNGSECARIDGSGNFKFNSGYGSVETAYGCRAWVNFNGSSGAIRASGNVTSVSRTAVGTYTVNLTTAMPDANYSAIATCDSVSSTPNLTTLATSAFGLNTRYAASNTSQDKTIVTAAVFR